MTPTGHSLMVPPGQPLIIYNPMFIQQVSMQHGPVVGDAMFRYLLQHECAHHVLGHILAGMANPYAIMWINPQIELDADCYASHQLFAAGDQAAADVAYQMWGSMGMAPTGPNYPSGIQRAQRIQQCFGP